MLKRAEKVLCPFIHQKSLEIRLGMCYNIFNINSERITI